MPRQNSVCSSDQVEQLGRSGCRADRSEGSRRVKTLLVVARIGRVRGPAGHFDSGHISGEEVAPG